MIGDTFNKEYITPYFFMLPNEEFYMMRDIL